MKKNCNKWERRKEGKKEKEGERGEKRKKRKISCRN